MFQKNVAEDMFPKDVCEWLLLDFTAYESNLRQRWLDPLSSPQGNLASQGPFLSYYLGLPSFKFSLRPSSFEIDQSRLIRGAYT